MNGHSNENMGEHLSCSQLSMSITNTSQPLMSSQPFSNRTDYMGNENYQNTIDSNNNFNFNLCFQTNMFYQQNNQTFEANKRHATRSVKRNNLAANGIEDKLDDPFKTLIKVIYQAYNEYLSPIIDLINEELSKNRHYNAQIPAGQIPGNYQNYQPNPNSLFDEMMRHFSLYSKKFGSFIQHIPGK